MRGTESRAWATRIGHGGAAAGCGLAENAAPMSSARWAMMRSPMPDLGELGEGRPTPSSVTLRTRGAGLRGRAGVRDAWDVRVPQGVVPNGFPRAM